MVVPAHILQQAMELYLKEAYPAPPDGPGVVPPAVALCATEIRGLSPGDPVPLGLLEQDVADASASHALRLGQPVYPHMKLVLDPLPPGSHQLCRGQDFLLRVDAHDRHLHAPADSPDAAWLASVRQSNKQLVDRIEADWAAAGLPTFKEFLRRQLEMRKKARVE